MTFRFDSPPTTTAEWEAAMQHELEGADCQETLAWRGDDGIAVTPYCRRGAWADLAEPPLPGSVIPVCAQQILDALMGTTRAA